MKTTIKTAAALALGLTLSLQAHAAARAPRLTPIGTVTGTETGPRAPRLEPVQQPGLVSAPAADVAASSLCSPGILERILPMPVGAGRIRVLELIRSQCSQSNSHRSSHRLEADPGSNSSIQ